MIIAGETRKSVGDFISQELSGFEKSVIRLYLAGNSYKEISELLSTHPKAVENALQRIRRQLKKLA
jgi:RNA polymerase sporulation-specific sigma factor